MGYSLGTIRDLLEGSDSDPEGRADLDRAWKKLPLLHRLLLTLQVQGYRSREIAKKVFGYQNKAVVEGVEEYISTAEMRLYLEMNGGNSRLPARSHRRNARVHDARAIRTPDNGVAEKNTSEE